MDDKLLEQVGHFIGKNRAEIITLTDHKLNEAVDILRGIMESDRESIISRVEKLNDITADEIGDKLKGLTTEHIEQIGQMAEYIKAQEVFEAQLTQRIAEIKDGEKGAQGEQGNDGEDGLDRPLIEPVELVAQSYPKSTVGTFDNGLWIATKDTVGSPEDDPQAWHCMIDALTTMSIDLQDDRRFKLSVRLSSGQQIEDEFDIPYPEHKGIWEEGEYKKGDIVTKGSSMWLAQEDTSGQPPGNGWQQILSAPRGKQGPAGKSITGPQGVPGRNGADAVLPENFVDDVMALAAERKAFEDGRSGSEAITSFRGYFSPSETYTSGDVVNFDGGLFVCVAGGRFESIAKSQGSWELMLGVPKFSTPAYMLWQGAWQQKTYSGGMTVRDNGWTMVALTETNERAAPQPIGDQYWVSTLDDTPDWGVPDSSAPTSELLYGQRYSIATTGYATGVRLWVDEADPNIFYSVAIVKSPESAQPNIDFLLPETSFASTGWVSIPMSSVLVGAGAVFDIAVRKYDRNASVDATWPFDYKTPNNPGIPLSGEILHANTLIEMLRISYEDNNGVDRSTTLDGIQPGDRISGAGVVWNVVTASDEGTYYEYEVTPAVQGTDGSGDFIFTTFTDQAISYVKLADHYIANDSVSGFYSTDGPGAAVVDEAGYGIDLQVQNAYISADWDVVSQGTSTGAASALSAQQTEWVSASSYGQNVLSKSAAVTSNVWTELGRVTILNPTKFSIILDAKSVTDVGYYSSEWIVLAWNDGGVEHDSKTLGELGATQLDMRVTPSGDDLIVEVKGQSNEEWHFTATIFYREFS